MTDTVDTPNTARGNTNELAPVNKILKKEKRARAWCFTLNNFEDDDIAFLTDTVDTAKYAFQHEIGESNTPHLQGVVYFENARTFDQLKKINDRIHWEPCRDLKRSLKYCTDPNKRAVAKNVWVKGWTLPKQLKLITELRPWQQQIIDIIKEEPDDRTIHWFWEGEGNVGKTALTKYILATQANVHYFSGGKANDIAFQVIKNNWDPEICIFNFPRTAEGAVSYNAIEQLKDGLIFSSKYEGGVKMFNPPHVLIFANWLPDQNTLSIDRWNIVQLK